MNRNTLNFSFYSILGVVWACVLRVGFRQTAPGVNRISCVHRYSGEWAWNAVCNLSYYTPVPTLSSNLEDGPRFKSSFIEWWPNTSLLCP